jgi:hypothetical protein
MERDREVHSTDLKHRADSFQGSIVLGAGGGGHVTKLALVMTGDRRGQVWVADMDFDEGWTLFPLRDPESLWSRIPVVGSELLSVVAYSAGHYPSDLLTQEPLAGLEVEPVCASSGGGAGHSGGPATTSGAQLASSPSDRLAADPVGPASGVVLGSSPPSPESHSCSCGCRFHVTMFTLSEPCESTRAILGQLKGQGVCIGVVYIFEGKKVRSRSQRST